jgi:hypothetical protein
MMSLVLASVVEFHIKAGGSSWNTKEEPLHAKVGDVLRLVNDDDIAHALHTDGTPCEHGDDIPAHGGVWEGVLFAAYDSAVVGPLRDHYNFLEKFWIVVEE